MFSFPARSVLVPTDFSEPSLEAVRSARGMLPSDGVLHVLHVLPAMSTGEPGVVWGNIDDEGRSDHASDALSVELGRLGVPDARIHVEIASGSPAHRIAEVAEKLGVELLVLPSHGRTGFARMALGSVAERVVRLAPCPVLVLRQKASS